ncbi:hypothetical protein C922_02683 [Plasmodium inui San Antonio 1]|uniref:Uncharacterized protein n=1 Tax=Plasmodium inui San Antonio 1 TaxID=1237626 RepID=W7ADH6_9APIC|nr:hypothetical protein C922_02683 [Plasmodium inui San Antonio 1]EUD67099.1 hypothetical protein C922_02683 [Plasmodium inui San Antonio 1]
MTLPHLLMNHERGTPIAAKQYDRGPPDGHVVKCYNLPEHICGEGILYYLLDVQKDAGFEIKKVLRPVKEETNLYPWKVICNEKFASFLLQQERIQIYDDLKRNNRVLVRLPRGKETHGEEACTDGLDKGGDVPPDDTVEDGVAPKKEETKGTIFRFIHPRKDDGDAGDSTGDPSCYSSHLVSSSQSYDLNEVKKVNRGLIDAASISITIGEGAPRGDGSYLSLGPEFERDLGQIGNGVQYCLYEESLSGGEDPRGGDGNGYDDGDSSDDSEGDLSNDGDSDWFGSESRFATDGEGIPKRRRDNPCRAEKHHGEGDEEVAWTKSHTRMNNKPREGQDSAKEDSQEEREKYAESYRSSNSKNIKRHKCEDYYQRKDSFKFIRNRNHSNTSDTKSGSELKSLVSFYRNDDTSVRNGEEGIITGAPSCSKRHSSIMSFDWEKDPKGRDTQENKDCLLADQMDEHTKRSRKKNTSYDAIEAIINEQRELLRKIKKRKKMNRRGLNHINIYFCPGSIDQIVRDVREEDAGVSVPTMVEFPLEEKRQFLLNVYGWRMEDHHKDHHRDDHHQDEDLQQPVHKIKLKRGNQNGEGKDHIEEGTEIEKDPLDQSYYNQGKGPNRDEASQGEQSIREDTSRNGFHENRASVISGRSVERRQDGYDPKRGGLAIWPSHLGWKEISEEIKSKLCVVIKNKPAEWSDYDLRKFIESQFSGTNHFPVFEDIFLTKNCPNIATVAFKNERLKENFLKCQKFKLPSSIRRYGNDGSYHHSSRYSSFLILQEYIVSHNGSHLHNAKKQSGQRKDGGDYTLPEKYKGNHSEVAPTRMAESTKDDFSRSGKYQSRNYKYVSDMRSDGRHATKNRHHDRSEMNTRITQYGKHVYHTRS